MHCSNGPSALAWMIERLVRECALAAHAAQVLCVCDVLVIMPRAPSDHRLIASLSPHEPTCSLPIGLASCIIRPYLPCDDAFTTKRDEKTAPSFIPLFSLAWLKTITHSPRGPAVLCYDLLLL